MAKAEHEKACETEPIDNTLDAVLVSALRENFEIKNGYHVDRNEILEFLRSVIDKHPELNFVLQHRDTKLSSRIYKAFPKVTTKRVAVPNIRGKKTWTYTNLRRITNQKDSQSKQDVKSHKKQITRTSKNDLPKEALPVAEPSIIPNTKRERKGFKNKRSVQGASMVHRDSLYETYRRQRESSAKNTRHVGHIPQQSYLGRFNDMLKWVKDHYVLDKNSTIQVKHVVESIKAEFKINITYKQSHKLIFAIFPGVTSRVPDPVKIVAQGGFYSYRGIALQPEPAKEEEESAIAETEQNSLKPNEPENINKSNSAKQTWIPPNGSAENGRKRIMRTRRRFIEACAVLKPAEEALMSPVSYDASPMPSDVAPVSSEILHKSPGVVSRYTDVPPMISDVATIERENNWRRMIDELKQERDQAIVERNQAMVSLMEIEREQTSRTPDDLPLRPATCPEFVPSATRLPKSEERRRDNPDWLKSLIRRSNSILGEQITEANAGYFPGSALQSASCNQRYPKQSGYTGDYIEIERYETLKQERDAIWKNWMEKMRAEKDDIIQQLKLDKMEVIQRMELEKSDAVECIEEKLTNQITILTREMRELKELLNHTMNERALAIEHAHKLMELVDEEKLKEAGLENFPFDVTKDHVVHLPKQKTTDETIAQKTLMYLGKGNKRKQSMPAKLKKIPRLDSSVSTPEECSDRIPGNESPTLSTDSYNLLSDSQSNVPASDNKVACGVGTAVDDDDNSEATMESTMVRELVVDKDSPIAQTAYSTTLNISKTPPADSAETTFPFNKERESVSAEKHTSTSSAKNVLDSETSAEISKNLESLATEDSKRDISEKSYDTFVASISEKIEEATNTAETRAKDSEKQSDNSGTVCFSTCSDEKQSPEILKSVNESVASFPSSSKVGISLPSGTNSEKNITGTSTTVPCTMNSNSDNFSADNRECSPVSPVNSNYPEKYEAVVPSNTQNYLSKTLGNLYSAFASNSGKYLREAPQALPASANSNFQKYVNEITRTVPSSPLNTDIQKFSPGIPRTVSNSSPKNFEESVSSTFLKYFPELPRSSFNSPLTAESSKYFRDVPRTVSLSVNSDSEKYVKDPGNQALVYPDEESFSEQSKVSSIDFLNSMVENIGKSSSE